MWKFKRQYSLTPKTQILHLRGHEVVINSEMRVMEPISDEVLKIIQSLPHLFEFIEVEAEVEMIDEVIAPLISEEPPADVEEIVIVEETPPVKKKKGRPKKETTSEGK